MGTLGGPLPPIALGQAHRSGFRLPLGCPGLAGLCREQGRPKCQLWTQADLGWTRLPNSLAMGLGALYSNSLI